MNKIVLFLLCAATGFASTVWIIQGVHYWKFERVKSCTYFLLSLITMIATIIIALLMADLNVNPPMTLVVLMIGLVVVIPPALSLHSFLRVKKLKWEGYPDL